jgi:threonine dehydratase
VAICSGVVEDVVHVSEADLVRGVQFLYERAKLACEPAGAAGVAALLAGLVDVSASAGVGVIVSGGNAALASTAELLAAPVAG